MTFRWGFNLFRKQIEQWRYRTGARYKYAPLQGDALRESC